MIRTHRKACCFFLSALLLSACKSSEASTLVSGTPSPSALVTTSNATQLPTSQPPIGGASEYSLKPWSSDDAWRMTLGGSQPDDSGRYTARKLTALREYLARYPEGAHQQETLDALSSPFLYYPPSIPVAHTLEPFRSQFEQFLNSEAGSAILPEALGQGWFESLYRGTWLVKALPANNVLGDGQPGWVLQVRWPDEFDAVFALTGNPGAYRLASPQDGWTHYAWSSEEAFVHDLNANGIPEIGIQESAWGTGMSHFCVERYRVYEWEGTSFASLAPGILISANTNFGHCLDFGFEPKPDGTQAITAGRLIFSSCTDPWEDGTIPGSLVHRS